MINVLKSESMFVLALGSLVSLALVRILTKKSCCSAEYAYVALVVAGLEHIVVEDIKQSSVGAHKVTVLAQDSIEQGRAGVGKVLFYVSSKDEKNIRTVQSLRSVQAVHALLCTATVESGFEPGSNLTTAVGPKTAGNRRRKLAFKRKPQRAAARRAKQAERSQQENQQLQPLLSEPAWPPQRVKERALQQICHIVQHGDWKNAMDLWAAHTVAPTSCGICFRVTAVRGGKHNFTSMELARDVGAAIVEKTGWKVDLTDFNYEVIIVLLQHSLVVGVSLHPCHPAPPPLPHDPTGTTDLTGTTDPTGTVGVVQQINEVMRSWYTPTVAGRVNRDTPHRSLYPSTAYLLLLLAEVSAGELVLDAMCGAATIPLQAAMGGGGGGGGGSMHAIGGDVAMDGLQKGARTEREVASLIRQQREGRASGTVHGAF